MKKSVLLSLAFLLVALAVGCSDGGGSGTKGSSAQPSMSNPGMVNTGKPTGGGNK